MMTDLLPMEPAVWASLIALCFAGGLTPGPAVMLTMASSLRYGFAPAMMAALGIATANLGWIVLAATGAGVLATKVPLLFLTLKLAGFGFVCWLAWSMAFGPASGRVVRAEDAPPRATLFLRGVGLQAANPNALVFFGGMLPSFFDAQRPILPQGLQILATMTVAELFGLTVYAAAAAGLALRFSSAAFARRFNRIAAVLMAGSAAFGIVATW
jgi:homoserine/homoserine lactone efflux protein